VIGRRHEHPDRQLAVINARDVTDRVTLERELRQARKMEAIARITSTVAHDFKNVLSVISGNADLALERAAEGSVREALVEISTAAKLGHTFTEQLLTFSGRRRRTVIVDVNAAINEVRSLFKRVLRSSATLTITTAATQPRVVLESGALQQVVLNLVVNARDAMSQRGTVTIATRNVLVGGSTGAGQQFVEIEVADSGRGMSSDVREQIFELYFTTKDDRTGGGLGLATVYGIVRDAGGAIAVDSEPGRGTTVTIRLPVYVPA